MTGADRAVEVNFDGLIGPTHSFAGLAHGNLASAANRGEPSNPRAAALQGVAKMRTLMSLGVAQAVLPPHERPFLPALRRMGFTGDDAAVLAAASRAPGLLANVSSASAMWTANAGTISPSADTTDGRVHVTPANLASHFHRALETATTTRVLKSIFADERRFEVHEAVPFSHFGDEGAANHMRLATDHGAPGIEVFVHGGSAFEEGVSARFRARQAVQASHVVATGHGLDWRRVLLMRQSQAAIDAGAFHNDVVAVADGPVLLAHPQAFEDQRAALDRLRAVGEAVGIDVRIETPDIPLPDAVSSYLFNSQLVTLPDGGRVLIAPVEVEETPSARAAVDAMTGQGRAINDVRYVDLRQSMRNGGGPACLRLRVVLTPQEIAALGAGVMMTAAKLDLVEAWIMRWYRDRLEEADLADPALLNESRSALDELSKLLDLGSIHDFQRA
ncbi:N-succinylarginine dihydrolase [bacterium]|nr:N-succinylarginine dihydrolase [bacterium]